jgi:hypothetical protein
VFTARCHMADLCNRLVEVWPWPPFSSSFTKSVTTIAIQELSDSTLYFPAWAMRTCELWLILMLFMLWHSLKNVVEVILLWKELHSTCGKYSLIMIMCEPL